MVSIVALLVGTIIEKFGGGLSDNMTQALIALVAIFTGGNVLEHISGVLKPLKGTKAGQVIEDILPGDQHLGAESQQQQQAAAEPTRQPAPIEQEFMAFANHVQGRMDELQKQIQVQAQGVAQLVQIVNSQRGSPAQQAPRRES